MPQNESWQKQKHWLHSHFCYSFQLLVGSISKQNKVFDSCSNSHHCSKWSASLGNATVKHRILDTTVFWIHFGILHTPIKQHFCMPDSSKVLKFCLGWLRGQQTPWTLPRMIPSMIQCIIQRIGKALFLYAGCCCQYFL